MSRSSFEVLCRYFYDPLDRLVRAGPSQRFYQQAHLVTELDDQGQRSILRHGAQALAQQNAAGESRLLATDRAHSPLLALSETLLQQISYTSYGHAPAQSGLSRLLGFNGECPERVTGHYLLGQGNRGFNPVLMRFNSPDPLSPFGDGGINPYAYCEGDPINFGDPSGKVKLAFLRGTFRHFARSPAREIPVVRTPIIVTTSRRNSVLDKFLSKTISSQVSQNSNSTQAFRRVASPATETSRPSVEGLITKTTSKRTPYSAYKANADKFYKLDEPTRKKYLTLTEHQRTQIPILENEIKVLEGAGKHSGYTRNKKVSYQRLINRAGHASYLNYLDGIKKNIRQ